MLFFSLRIGMNNYAKSKAIDTICSTSHPAFQAIFLLICAYTALYYKFEPSSLLFYINVIQIYYYSDAFQAYEQAAKLGHEDAVAYCRMGHILFL